MDNGGYFQVEMARSAEDAEDVGGVIYSAVLDDSGVPPAMRTISVDKTVLAALGNPGQLTITIEPGR